MFLVNLLTLASAAADRCTKVHILTLVPWFKYLPDSDFSGCDIKHFNLGIPGNGQPSDVPLILAAIIDDLLQIAGLVALGFVIVGAIKFTAAQGNPEAAANARGTVVNALIGLAIAITGIAFVNFLGTKLGS